MRENIGALENTSNDIKDENGFYPGSRIYVSDQVNALLRFEPAANVRSAGALHPGDTVEFKSYSRDKRFAQIVWDGKTYWMRTGDLQSAPAAVNQVEEYKARLAQLNEEIEKEDIDYVVDNLKEIVAHLREMSPLYEDFIKKQKKQGEK